MHPSYWPGQALQFWILINYLPAASPRLVQASPLAILTQ